MDLAGEMYVYSTHTFFLIQLSFYYINIYLKNNITIIY